MGGAAKRRLCYLANRRCDTRGAAFDGIIYLLGRFCISSQGII